MEPFDFKDKYAVKKHKRKECTFRKSLTSVKKKKKKKKKVGTAFFANFYSSAASS